VGFVLLDLATGKQLFQIRPLSPGHSSLATAFFSADGSQFYTGDVFQQGRSETTLRVWDVPAAKLAASFPVGTRSCGRLALGAHGQWIGFDYDRDGKYRFGFLDLVNGQPAHDVSTAPIGDVAFAFAAAGGSWYAAVSDRVDRIEFFDLTTGKPVLAYDGIPRAGVGAFSADDRHAAVPGQGGVWLFRLPQVGGAVQ
jgi:hypothetical protein